MNLTTLSKTPARLVGLAPSNPLIQETLGIDKLEWDEGICWFSYHLDAGVETDFRGASEDCSVLDTLFLYVSEDSANDASDIRQFSAFSEPLPYGIEKNFDETDVLNLLGSPEWVREEIKNDIAGFIPRALQYSVSRGKKLKIEFKDNLVYRLVIHLARE